MIGRLIARRNRLFSHLQDPCKLSSKNGYCQDGRTTVRILNKEENQNLMIDAYGTYGFRLNNGISVLGAMAIFPRAILSWQVQHSAQVTEDSLKLFKLLVPNIDVLVLGLETDERKVRERMFRLARFLGLNVEILPVDKAVTTFNFLSVDCRNVAGAMIPPVVIDLNEDDMLNTALRYRNLYKQTL